MSETLTATYVYQGSPSGATLLSALNGITFSSLSGTFHIIPVAGGKNVQVIKVERA